jgi:hypothetical protein
MNEVVIHNEITTEKGHKLPKSKVRKKRVDKSLTKVEILAKGIMTGIVVSAVTHTARGITGFIVRQPVAMFALGLVSGYFVHKYRNEFVYVADHTVEHSKQFLLRQKESLNDLMTEAEQYAAERNRQSH